VAFSFSGLWVRVVSAVVLGVPTVAVIVWGRPFLELWLAAFVALMGREWHALCGGSGWTPTRLALIAAALGALCLAALDRYGDALLLAGFGSLAIYWLARREPGLRASFTAAGVPYIGVSAVALSWLRAGPDGLANLAWVFLVVWVTDTAAYAAGRSIGGPKLAPRISPQKTWAGALGGLMGAGAVGAGMALAARAPLLGPIAASLALSVVSQAGDLAESAVKRRFGVKDSGAIIPGHGGLFDRADALLAAAPGAALALYVCGANALWR
jgi:phosphatidate cytidylyltransferase